MLQFFPLINKPTILNTSVCYTKCVSSTIVKINRPTAFIVCNYTFTLAAVTHMPLFSLQLLHQPTFPRSYCRCTKCHVVSYAFDQCGFVNYYLKRKTQETARVQLKTCQF